MTILGYSNKETLCTSEARTVRELIDHLEDFCKIASADANIIYTENSETNNVTLRLIENTLTDGSKTYDVRIS